MATNCPQLLNPRACRSALCFRTAVSKPVREMSCKICEKMLHTRFKAESSSDSLVFSNSTYQRLSAFFFPATLSTAELIWTRMIRDIQQYQSVEAARRHFKDKSWRILQRAYVHYENDNLARIIHDCGDTKSLFCYKHVVATVLVVAREAFACPTIARHSVCCSPIFFPSLPCCSSIIGRAVPMAEPCC